MKKRMSLILAFIMCLSLCACAKNAVEGELPNVTTSTEAPTSPRPVVTVPPTVAPQAPEIVPLTNLLAEPEYPEMPQYLQPYGYADSLTDFFHDSITQFLQGKGNQVYSPLNVYMALAMLAETTDGNSRQQILDLFGLDTIEQLREQVNYLWNAHYCEDGVTSTLLANSMWLDDEYTFKKETAQLLAEHYYASSFSGDLGTNEMNKQLQSWINENTGGLLTEQANNLKLDDETAAALASTVYFTASWESKFGEKYTKEALFHSADVDRKVPFMNKTLHKYQYYWGENFGAVRLWLTGDNCMWLILPDEGYTVADILSSDDYLQMTLDPVAWENQKEYTINLSLPKFDIAQQQDLVSGMKAMGLTDIFDVRTSDFSPLTDWELIWVDKIDHAVRVSVDEEGCKGAAYTVIVKPGAVFAPEVEEINFVLDRPFAFVVSSRDNLPLFAGIVNEP